MTSKHEATETETDTPAAHAATPGGAHRRHAAPDPMHVSELVAPVAGAFSPFGDDRDLPLPVTDIVYQQPDDEDHVEATEAY